MVSSFYSSNEKKLKQFKEDRKIKQVNEEYQQEIVDNQINKDLGLETRATNLAKLASRVVNKIGTEIMPTQQTFSTLQYTPLKLLINSINNGTLSQLFQKIKELPNNSLNKTQKLIKQDMSKPEIKELLNDSIAEALPDGPEAVAKAVVDTLGGDGNEKEVLEMIDYSSDENKKLQKIDELKSQKKNR